MRSFQYVATLPRVFCGPDSLAALGRELERLERKRAVIVCGGSFARSGAPLALVRTALGQRFAGVYDGVRAHSPLPVVLAAADALRKLDADAVVAVGGGSAVVTARAAAIVLAEGADVRALATSRDDRGQLRSPKLLVPKLPQFVVPTTPNTATVKAGTAVHDPSSGERLAMFDPKTRAQAVFVHPDILATAPPALVVSASLDTLTLALEGLMSAAASPMSDASLMHAIRLIARRLMDDAGFGDGDARIDLMLGAVLCGHGTDSTGAGIATVLGHAVGGSLGAENGVVKAVLMPYALRFNADAAADGILKIAAALEAVLHRRDSLIDSITDTLGRMFAQLGVPRCLRDVGVPRETIPAVAAAAMGDWFLRGNPRPVRSPVELVELLEAAW